MRRLPLFAASAATLVTSMAVGARPVLADEVVPGAGDAMDGAFVGVLLVVLLATGLLLAVAAFVAYRLRREAESLKGPGTPESWWSCAACGQLNSADRDGCFNCHAERPVADEPPPAPDNPPAAPAG